MNGLIGGLIDERFIGGLIDERLIGGLIDEWIDWRVN